MGAPKWPPYPPRSERRGVAVTLLDYATGDAPKWPPISSSEGGDAPLGLPGPTFGAPRRSRGTPRRHASALGEPTTCDAWWSTILQPSASRWKMFVAMTDVTDTRPRTWERMFSVQ